MFFATIFFLAFALWTLFHWQELPELLKNETADEQWPLSIHHTATPSRLITITLLFSVFSYSLLKLLNLLISLVMPAALSVWTPWICVGLLIAAHFTPYLSGISSYVRYYFQRHLFFPSLPSHQEDTIIDTLMSQAEKEKGLTKEVQHLQDLLKDQFKATIHVFNLVSLKREHKLVRREFKKMRHKGLLENEQLSSTEQQQLRFHLYSCYRLLTRITLARYWAGRDRRRAFRNLGYTINTGDSDLYSKCRRLKYSVSHYLLHREKH